LIHKDDASKKKHALETKKKDKKAPK
jgi:hypothetical protein